MQYAFFRISTSAPTSASEQLNEFIHSHSVINVEKHFHADGADGFWSFCLQWQDSSAASSSLKSKNPAKIDYRTVLSDAQFSVYALLRDQRKQLAEKDGVPVYAVATNDQLAAMVRGSMTTKSALQQIPGFGESIVERYGKVFLAAIQENFDALAKESSSRPRVPEGAAGAKSPEVDPD